jgi:phosphatidylglycerol:prolipoprotein diacylglycerol transferase
MDFSWWNLIPTKFDGIAIQLGNFPIMVWDYVFICFATCYFVMWKSM